MSATLTPSATASYLTVCAPDGAVCVSPATTRARMRPPASDVSSALLSIASELEF